MRPSALTCILLAVCFAVSLIACSDKASNPDNGGGETFEVEVESFALKSDFPGSVPIHPEECSTASGGYAVVGMDRANEWIEIALTIPAAGVYDVTIRYAAPKDSIIEIRMTADPCGSTREADFTLDEGERIG